MLLAAALLVGGLLFQQLVTLLLAILITIIIAIPLSACATRLERYGVPRWLGALVALVGSALVLAGILALIIPSFVDQVKELVDAVPAIFQDLRDRFREATGAKPSKAGTDVQTYLQRYVDDPGKLAGPISETVLGIAGGLASALLVIVTAYYVAVSPEPLVRGVLRVFPPPAPRVGAARHRPPAYLLRRLAARGGDPHGHQLRAALRRAEPDRARLRASCSRSCARSWW